MSAYLMNPSEIGTLAAYATQDKSTQFGACYNKGLDELSDVAECLALANIESVEDRYKGTEGAEKFMGISNAEFISQCLHSAIGANLTPYNPGQIARLAATYDYQASEPDGWYDSRAFKVLTVIRERLVRGLPGYD